MKKALLLSLALLTGVGTRAAPRPNIVIIFADDLDADEINCTSEMIDTWPTHSGCRQKGIRTAKPSDPRVYTPNIDSLAGRGMLFTRFYVNATVCSSSRYCLLTGRYPSQGKALLRDTPAGEHHTLGWEPDILRDESSLPKELRKLGYRTGIIGKWHNMPRDAVDLPKRNKELYQANATYETTKQAEAEIRKRYRAHRSYLLRGFGWDVVDRMEWGNSIVNLDWQCQGALEFIEESSDRPFFLYCALPVPHGQYRFKYNDISTYDRRVTSDGLLEKPLEVLPSNESVYRRCRENGVPGVNAMATRMDDYVGAILEKLEALGLRENTLVLFTSDHGSRGKNSVYEGGARMPMLISWPAAVKPGTRNESLVGSIDVSATLIDVAGGTPPVDMTEFNRSFLPQLLGRPEPADWRRSMLIEAGNSKGIVTAEFKYVANRVPPAIEQKMKERPGEVFWTGLDHHNYNTESMYPGYWDPDQLYDMNRDLYEQVNLAASPESAAILNQMKQELGNFIKRFPHTFGEFGN